MAEQTLDGMDKAGIQSRITALNTVKRITASEYNTMNPAPRGVVLQALTKDIWVSTDGNDASATVGFKLIVGPPQMFPFHPSDLSFLEVEASAELRYVIVKGR